MHAGLRRRGILAAVGLAFGLVSAALGQGSFKYPPAPRESTVETIHGVEVADPFRWLEDNESAATKAWVTAQNEITMPYLKAIPQRAEIEKRITELWNYERFGAPSKDGGLYFYSYNSGLLNQPILYVTKSVDERGEVLIDPKEFDASGTKALAGASVSDDGKYYAYAVADGGSDWNIWRIRDIATKKDLADEIRWVKFSGASWLPDSSGFLYSRYDEPKAGQELTAVNYYPKMYLHKVGQKQAENVKIYERPDQKEWGIGGGVTEDDQYLILSLSQGTDPKNRLFVRDLKANPLGSAPTETDGKIAATENKIRTLQDQIDAAGKGADTGAIQKQIQAAREERAKLVASQANMAHGFLELLNEFDGSYEYVGNDGPVFYISTNLNAPKTRLISIDLRKPARENWKEIIPEAAETLQGVGMVGDYFFVSYLKDAKTQVKQFDRSGKLVREVKFPGIGSAGGFGGKREDKETFYSFTSYNVPPSVYKFNIETGESVLWKRPSVKFNPDDFEVSQQFYTSKDGTKVPMFIAHKKGIKLDGTNPTLLYGYGGFNIPLTPGFSPRTIAWLERGGVYVVANIRGGGEYGEAWHKAGTGVTKQNVFDDFISAAEHLIDKKYTSKGKIACEGGSNGGLLVGAMIAQRPDLWGAALPAVGVMDMLRFQKFTIGWAWKSDYGDTEGDKAVFDAVYAYSPYHAVLRAKSPQWPATMVLTADRDDRVVPAHSFKFAAAIQATQTGDQPVLIRIDTRAGHGAGKSTSQRIEEAADVTAFLVKHLGAK
ncbi:MAG: S9 family peptidase [Tepidisphaera sp.]|jgi:prolyl oligopeptidase